MSRGSMVFAGGWFHQMGVLVCQAGGFPRAEIGEIGPRLYMRLYRKRPHAPPTKGLESSQAVARSSLAVHGGIVGVLCRVTQGKHLTYCVKQQHKAPAAWTSYLGLAV